MVQCAGPPKKRPRTEELDLKAVTHKILEKHRLKSMADLTIPELKCFLKSHKATVGGKKADLITRAQGLLTK